MIKEHRKFKYELEHIFSYSVGIYWPLVWQTVQDDVPGLRAQIAAVLASLPLKPGTE